jgi:hypothetical protein
MLAVVLSGSADWRGGDRSTSKICTEKLDYRCDREFEPTSPCRAIQRLTYDWHGDFHQLQVE